MTEGKPVRPIRRDELRKFKHIVVVFGSRNFKDREMFSACVEGFIRDNHFTPETTVFVSGLAEGPDKFIIDWAKEQGWRWHECPADWKNIDVPGALVKPGPYGQYNARAGFTRNQEMANVSTHGLGFWNYTSPGTKDMVDRCKQKQINLRIIRIQD